MKTPEIIDARGGDYVTAQGDALRTLIKNRIAALQDDYRRLLDRIDYEIADKKDAVGLLIALAGGGDINERAMFFKACLDKAARIEKEIRELNTLGASFRKDAIYRITIKDAERFGL